MFANNHHDDGHIAVWVPVPPGMQEMLIETQPETFYYPAYVGVRGWIGIELAEISDEDLEFYIDQAWQIIAPKRLLKQYLGDSDE